MRTMTRTVAIEAATQYHAIAMLYCQKHQS